MEEKKPKLLFVISTGRSGSTMLRQLLNTHTNIVVPEREFGELNDLLLKFDSYGDLNNPKNFRKFYEDAKDITFINLAKNTDVKKGMYKISEEDWFHKSKSNKIEDLFKELLIYFAEVSEPNKSNLAWIGDKSPQHYHALKELIQSFPNASYLFLTRNPIDIALSQDRFAFRHFENDFGFKKVNEAWKKLHQRSNSVLKIRTNSNITRIVNARNLLRNSNAKYMEVSYEDLTSKLEPTLKEIAEFLEVKNDFILDEFQIHKASSGQNEGTNKILSNNKLKYLKVLNPKMIRELDKDFLEHIKLSTDKDYSGSYTYEVSKFKTFIYKIQYFINTVLAFIGVFGLKNGMKIIYEKYINKKYKKSTFY